MLILLGWNSILVNLVTVLTSRHSGCIDCILIPQRTAQSRAIPAPLPQGEGQQLLQSHGMAALEVHF